MVQIGSIPPSAVQENHEIYPSEQHLAQLFMFFLYQSGQSPLSDEIFVKSLRECEKWIPHKMLHRLSGPIFFQLNFFR